MQKNLKNLIFIIFACVYIYTIQDFDFDIFSDRDILRAENPFRPLQIYGAELNLKHGNRVLGGFNYYFIFLIKYLTNNPVFMVYFLLGFIFLSFYYLLEQFKKEISNFGACFAITIFFCTDATIFQTHKFWNPTLGFPFAIFGIAFFFNYIKKLKNKFLFLSVLAILIASQFHSSYLFIIIF